MQDVNKNYDLWIPNGFIEITRGGNVIKTKLNNDVDIETRIESIARIEKIKRIEAQRVSELDKN